jgi:hypothetical protein
MDLQRITETVIRFFGGVSAEADTPAARLFSHDPSWPGCGTEYKLRKLLRLSRSAATMVKSEISDGAAYASRCISSSQSIPSYHSRMLLEMPLNRQKTGAVVALNTVWLIDFARPANFRVIQITGGEASYNDCDRWTTIGNAHFEPSLSLFAGSPAPESRQRTNESLTMDKWLLLLGKHDLLSSASVYHALGQQYVLLKYKASSPSGVMPIELPPEVSEYGETAYAWIDYKSGRLAKCEIELTGQLRTGAELPSMRLHQIFSGYDHEIDFDPRRPFPLFC